MVGKIEVFHLGILHKTETSRNYDGSCWCDCSVLYKWRYYNFNIYRAARVVFNVYQRKSYDMIRRTIMTYTMMTTRFNFEEFSSIDLCVEEMKKNGWKNRSVSFGHTA